MKKIILGLVGFIIILTGCSLQAPERSSGVKIIIEDSSESIARDFMVGPKLPDFSSQLMASTPTAISDFQCFVVNVTGAGVPSVNGVNLEGCSSQNNFHGTGVGALSRVFQRGEALTMQITSGTNRVIDVYGAFPNPHECGGGSSGGGDGGGGYFLGRVTQDIAQDTTVTVPISYTGASADLVCTGGSGGGFYVSSPFPYGGRNTGGWTTNINGSGFIALSVVRIGGVPCTSQTVISGNTISCVVPAIGSGSYDVTVDNQNGQVASTTGAFFSIVSPASPFVSADVNTSNVDFGNVAVGATKDIVVTFSSNGGVVANLLASPTTFSAPFSMFGTTCSFGGTLAVDATCTVTVRFSPLSTGAASNSAVSFFSAGGPNINFNGTGI